MSSSGFLSSGDLIADRRFEWARELVAGGDLAAAADLYAQTVERVPGYAAAWFALGETRDALGDRAGAIAAFEQARSLDPEDRHGAAVHLARLGALPPVAMPIGYVRSLFDGYAAGFDDALTRGLNYRGPDLLLRATAAARSGRPLRFGTMLDLGCGTGLAGAAFRSVCDRIVGVDLSPGMLAQARAKGVHDRLEEAEAMTFLRAEGDAGARYDLIVAADVFVYFHELMQVPGPVLRVLAPDGLLVFSVETHEGEGVILRDTLRYAHSLAHVRDALAAGGLRLVRLESAWARTEKGVPVPGLIVVAGR